MTIASPKQAYSQVMLKNESSVNRSQDRKTRYPSTTISGTQGGKGTLTGKHAVNF